MANLVDRLVGSFTDIQKIKNISQCTNCGLPDTNNKMYAGSCHHGVYCWKCMDQSKCGACMSKEIPQSELIAMLKQMQFSCNNAPEGCNKLLKFGEIEEHERLCPYRKQEYTSNPSKIHSPNMQPFPDSFLYNNSQGSPFKKYPQQAQPYYPKEQGNDLSPILLNSIILIIGLSALEKRVEFLERNSGNFGTSNLSELKSRVDERTFVTQSRKYRKKASENLHTVCAYPEYILDRDFLWNNINTNQQKLDSFNSSIKSHCFTRN